VEPLPALTDEQRQQALDVIRSAKETGETVGNVAALRQVGVHGTRGQLRALIDDDFAHELRTARGYGNETIRAEIARRAIEGVEEDVWHNGEVVGKRIVYSDRLLSKMADAFVPEFRDVKRVELTGKDGGAIQLLAGRFDPDQLTLEELEQVRGLLDKATPKEITDGNG
jgi:hypothetical protein